MDSLDSLAELKTAFQLFDKDQDGVISRKELKEMFINLGHDCTDDDIKEIFERFESKDSISFPEFLELATEKRLSQKNLTLELIETFRIFDRDNMNFITADDLRYILKNFCKTLKMISEFDFRLLPKGYLILSLNEQEVDTLMKEIDENGDGNISFEEFVNMILMK